MIKRTPRYYNVMFRIGKIKGLRPGLPAGPFTADLSVVKGPTSRFVPFKLLLSQLRDVCRQAL